MTPEAPAKSRRSTKWRRSEADCISERTSILYRLQPKCISPLNFVPAANALNSSHGQDPGTRYIRIKPDGERLTVGIDFALSVNTTRVGRQSAEGKPTAATPVRAQNLSLFSDVSSLEQSDSVRCVSRCESARLLDSQPMCLFPDADSATNK